MDSLPKATDRQSAVRLLACIDACSTPNDDKLVGNDVVGILRGQAKLQALDFWMRNPDYLANELINEFEKTKNYELLRIARQIFADREPDLRKLPMLRYRFGAFEPLDDALSILRARDLIRIIRREGAPGQVREHNYLLTVLGRSTMNDLADAAPELAWYKERAKLVSGISGDSGGKALKDRQYLQKEYASTELNHVISPISDRVLLRLKQIEQKEVQYE